MPLHEDQIAANRATLRTFNMGEKLGIVDATVAAPVTVGSGLRELQAAVTAVPVHEDQKGGLFRVNKALKVAYDIGTLTDATIIATTTVAGMRAYWVTADPTITDPTMYGNIVWGD
jgi:hypothetical protein